MASIVARRVYDGRNALFGHRQKVVVHGSGTDGIDGDRDVAVGPVFETDRHRQARSKLAVDLRLGCAGADSTPRDKVTNVLRGNGIQEFRRSGDAEFVEVNEEATGQLQALVDGEAGSEGAANVPNGT